MLQIANPYRVPMLVDEIAFGGTSRGADEGTPPVDAEGDPLASFEVDMRIGRAPITDGFVNLAMFARAEDNANPANGRYVNWKLGRPMLVGPQAPLSVFLRASSEKSGDRTTTLWCIVRGRALPQQYVLPQVSFVPYLSVFSARWEETTGTARSTSPRLTNISSRPMVVQRLLGRATTAPLVSTDDVTVQLSHSNGSGVIKTAIPFDSLFQRPFSPGQCREVPVKFELAPRDALFARLTNGTEGTLTTYFGMQGYRAEPINEVL